MDALLTLLGVAGVNYVMGVPGADDVMLDYQSTSFHDALYLRGALGLRPAPEFEAWLARNGPRRRRPGTTIPVRLAPVARGPRMTAPTLWRDLRRFTPARVALGRAGNGLPTAAHLAFQAAHAARPRRRPRRTRHPLPAGRPAAAGFASAVVRSACPDRATYLLRPDLGRRLQDAGDLRPPPVLPIRSRSCCADGLSATAVQRHAVPLLSHLRRPGPLRLGPVVIAAQGRVALGDEIGAALGAEAVAVLIGERPGLSAPDSLGVYLTWQPRPGRTDAERNCISNIRPGGLSPSDAAAKLAWLAGRMRALQLTGIALKDEQPLPDQNSLAGQNRSTSVVST